VLNIVWISVFATSNLICVSLVTIVIVAMAIVRFIILYILDIIFFMEIIRDR